MDLRHLRYFMAVAEELHFGRAAKRLNIAQPPLSQQIRDLERELGVELFRRTSRKVELSRHGHLLRKEAEAMLKGDRRIRELMTASGRGDVGRLSIGFVHSAVHSVLTPALREFHTLNPGVEISCRTVAPAHQIEALQKREIDAGLIRFPHADSSVQAFPLLREWFILAMAKDHPRAGDFKVRLADFAGEPMAIFARQNAPALYDRVVGSCEEAGFFPRFTQEANDLQSLLALAAAGLCVGFVPSSIQNLSHPGLIYKGIEKPPEIELSLVIRRGEAEPIVLSFVDICRRVAARPSLNSDNEPTWEVLG